MGQTQVELVRADGQGARAASRIPLGVKVAYTAFVCILVPYYWNAYGPTNFLYFCDVSLFLALAGMWLESPLLVSMPAVGIVLPQTFWVADFLCELAGLHLTGMTGYMFDPAIPLAARLLSLFHGWLPFLLVWMVYRLGYDRRALPAWTVLAWALMLVCYFFLPAPPGPGSNVPCNVNYVYGLSDRHPQEWMPPGLYLALMMVVLPIGFFLPTHFLLKKLFPRPGS